MKISLELREFSVMAEYLFGSRPFSALSVEGVVFCEFLRLSSMHGLVVVNWVLYVAYPDGIFDSLIFSSTNSLDCHSSCWRCSDVRVQSKV